MEKGGEEKIRLVSVIISHSVDLIRSYKPLWASTVCRSVDIL